MKDLPTSRALRLTAGRDTVRDQGCLYDVPPAVADQSLRDIKGSVPRGLLSQSSDLGSQSGDKLIVRENHVR